MKEKMWAKQINKITAAKYSLSLSLSLLSALSALCSLLSLSLPKRTIENNVALDKLIHWKIRLVFLRMANSPVPN